LWRYRIEGRGERIEDREEKGDGERGRWGEREMGDERGEWNETCDLYLETSRI